MSLVGMSRTGFMVADDVTEVPAARASPGRHQARGTRLRQGYGGQARHRQGYGGQARHHQGYGGQARHRQGYGGQARHRQGYGGQAQHGTQHSALSTQHPALSTQHSAPSTQHPALALSTQHRTQHLHSAPSTDIDTRSPRHGMVGRVQSVLGAVALVFVASSAWSQTAVPGRAQDDQFCARCHGGDGRGGQMGPGIVARLPARSDAEVAMLVGDGVPAKACRALFSPNPSSTATRVSADAARARRRCFSASHGRDPRRRTLDGVALNQSSVDLQLLTDDGRLHLLRRRQPATAASPPTWTGPAITDRPPEIASAASTRSRAATSRGWRRMDVHDLGCRAASSHPGRSRRGHVRYQRQ